MDANTVFLIILGVLLLLVAISYYFNYQKSKKVKAKIASEYGKEPVWTLDERDYNSMKRYYRKKPPEGREIDDITWMDLNMDAVFKRVKNTRSSVGDEYCYRYFRHQQGGDLPYMEQAVRAVDRDHVKRNQLQYAFYKIGRRTGNKLIDLILDPEGFPAIPYWGILLAALIGVLSIALLFVNPDYGVLAVSLCFCASLILFFFVLRRIGTEIATLGLFVRLIRAAQFIVKLDMLEFHRETEELKTNLKVFRRIGTLAEVIMGAMTGSGGGIFMLIVAYFGLYAVVYRMLVGLFTKNRKQTLALYEAVGYIELCISIASYRASLPYYCTPSFCEGSGVEFEDMVHPLLKKPVPNSHVTGNKLLITGSNTSGKSTFARTLAVNTVLGQLINTCLAVKFIFRPSVVYTSMNLKDDILAGDSFYVAEVKSLKRLMNEAAAPEYSMLFLDEIFKGTNRVERISAASVVLKDLAAQDCFVCLTTHDLELCRILGDRYENYHFEEQIRDDDILFDFKLREGMTTGSNAIRMLAYCKYRPEIVSQAKSLAEAYRQTGEWGAMDE